MVSCSGECFVIRIQPANIYVPPLTKAAQGASTVGLAWIYKSKYL